MLTHTTGKMRPLAAFWNEKLVRTFQRKLGIPFDEKKVFTYECHGCKSDLLFENCAVCAIRKCAVDKKVEHCTDCGEYPCNQLRESRKMASLLPHLRSNEVNLETIKIRGTQQWLAKQEETWKCPGCKVPYSWYTRRCPECGEDLRKRAFRFTRLQAAMLKLGIALIKPKREEKAEN
jgi:hypothetical protein